MLLGKRREREVEWEGEQQEINWVWLIPSARREERRKDMGAMFFGRGSPVTRTKGVYKWPGHVLLSEGN